MPLFYSCHLNDTTNTVLVSLFRTREDTNPLRIFELPVETLSSPELIDIEVRKFAETLSRELEEEEVRRLAEEAAEVDRQRRFDVLRASLPTGRVELS